MISQKSLSVVVCDGCGKELVGAIGGSHVEARGQAYAEGWRFPKRLRADGSPANLRHSDVCPACIDSWQPLPASVPWSPA